jgi:cell wall-associated NlpC family hydrolase
LATVGRSEEETNGNGAEFEPPTESEIGRIARSGGSSRNAAELAAQVVQTAVDLMGTPYKWGGTDENGFDCSGLIKYAYEYHQIIIPRVSRDQVRTGTFVEPRVDQLRPGDILGFSVERARVSHVGLYVGNGQFIHSASGGVRISSLTTTDANSRWWQRRFVVARRVIN